MASLIVSFCNVFPHGLALGIYEFAGSRFRWVDLSGVGETVSGTTGLTLHEGAYWCLAQLSFGASALVKMDRSLGLRQVWTLAETRDAHSLVPFENGLLANDTAGNRLVWLELPGGEEAPREVEYWRYCNERTDAFHVNSVACMNGQVYVSMFGPRPESGWQAARSGMIVNTTTNEIVADGVFHPHSLKGKMSSSQHPQESNRWGSYAGSEIY